jgi:hypothetical protein
MDDIVAGAGAGYGIAPTWFYRPAKPNAIPFLSGSTNRGLIRLCRQQFSFLQTTTEYGNLIKT